MTKYEVIFRYISDSESEQRNINDSRQLYPALKTMSLWTVLIWSKTVK